VSGIPPDSRSRLNLTPVLVERSNSDGRARLEWKNDFGAGRQGSVAGASSSKGETTPAWRRIKSN